MPPHLPKPLRLLTAVILIIFVAWPISGLVEAKGRKGQSASRSKSSKRTSARRVQRRSNNSNESEEVTSQSYPIAPDHIEVIESGTASTDLARYLYLPPPRSQPPIEAPDADPNSLTKRKGLKIDESRALQIQQALKQRGFYTGELTGAYDQSTVEAMRNFQTQEKIPVTGYPTAHALKRLGLASW
ncbi:MAG: peptidoglycan-binding protein [Chloracidobacterium sp.]|nr:peptidoglycan-binding protein [Chloracidobacterium sp.]